MKPLGPTARRRDYAVRPIADAVGAEFITARHYARGCSNTGTMHGLFRAGHLVGVAQWLPPTRVCAETVDRERWRRVLSLTRLVLNDAEPTNAETILLGAAVRLLRRARKWVALVTFADESQGHTGAVYRAAGWEYVGRTRPEARYVTADGRQVSRKAGRRSRTHAEMVALGYEFAGRFAKHKFVRRLAV